MKEIAYYEFEGKKYKFFLDFINIKKTKGNKKIPIVKFLKMYVKFILKVQCYNSDMFNHFIVAWNLQKTEPLKAVELPKNMLYLLFTGDWHEVRQFMIIIETYLNDKGIKLTLNHDMINAILMTNELIK